NERASPAPVQRAPRSPITCRAGMMPRPSANGSDEPPSAEPAPAPSKAVTANDVPHAERAAAIAQNQNAKSKHFYFFKQTGELRRTYSCFARTERAHDSHVKSILFL